MFTEVMYPMSHNLDELRFELKTIKPIPFHLETLEQSLLQAFQGFAEGEIYRIFECLDLPF